MGGVQPKNIRHDADVFRVGRNQKQEASWTKSTIAKIDESERVLVAHVFNDVAAENPAKAPRLGTEVRLSVLLAHAESFLPACGQGFFRMINPTRLDAGVGQKLEECSPSATDVEHWSGISKKLDERLLNPANRVFAAAKLV